MKAIVSSSLKAQEVRSKRENLEFKSNGTKLYRSLEKMFKVRDALADAKATIAEVTGEKYMIVTADEAIRIYENNKSSFTSFTFVKISDCTLRTISTRQTDIGVSGTACPSKNKDQYNVFDTNLAKKMIKEGRKEEVESGGAWRSFNKKSLVSMRHNGTTYLIA
ncbi:hypothetical protein [Acinetobacter phage P577]|uniref:hypothetical protein n=1 Tax=Acinetobacter phage YMC13/03/R2096 TaxID=1560342 RepID=UPI00052AC4A6|nr:hypothetical protein ACQ36_gp122 [Acinetobacter phage YMC13/03/R2096]AIW02811.1 hypothetical protein BPABA577_00770 [Acinetobacter phage YMC13/03/R2096]WNT46135.1 hypothetical protein [Acinetobacter phage P577]